MGRAAGDCVSRRFSNGSCHDRSLRRHRGRVRPGRRAADVRAGRRRAVGRGGVEMTASLAPSRRSQAAPPPDAGLGFEVYDPDFEAVLGGAPRLVLVAETDAHEGPVYVPGADALYFTTVPQAAESPQAGGPRAAIRGLALDGCSFPPNRPGVQPGRGHHWPDQPAPDGQLHLRRPRGVRCCSSPRTQPSGLPSWPPQELAKDAANKKRTTTRR
jgi:hypothetical protein